MREATIPVATMFSAGAAEAEGIFDELLIMAEGAFMAGAIVGLIIVGLQEGAVVEFTAWTVATAKTAIKRARVEKVFIMVIRGGNE